MLLRAERCFGSGIMEIVDVAGEEFLLMDGTQKCCGHLDGLLFVGKIGRTGLTCDWVTRSNLTGVGLTAGGNPHDRSTTMNNDASTNMTETTETVGDILDQIAERLATFPNVTEEIRPAGGAGDVGVDVDAVYGLLPPSPSHAPAAIEEETDEEEGAAPVEEETDEEEAKSEDQPDESESPVTPPRTIPGFTEPPAVLRKRRVLPEDDEESDLVSLRTYSMPTVLALERNRSASAAASLPTDMTDIQRQVCRPITPVLGEVARTPCFMSDTEGEETDNEGVAEEEDADADDEAEAEAEEQEQEQEGEEEDDIHPEEQLMVKIPFWIFGLTCAMMTLYLTFVIYLLSWECRFPMRGAH